MPDYAFYCRRCWQEFDDPAEHNSGSWLSTNTGNHRLDGPCPGDIHCTENTTQRKRKFQKQTEGLAFGYRQTVGGQMTEELQMAIDALEEIGDLDWREEKDLQDAQAIAFKALEEIRRQQLLSVSAEVERKVAAL